MHSSSLNLDVMIMLEIVRITNFADRVYPFGYFWLQATQNNLRGEILSGSETICLIPVALGFSPETLCK